MNETLTENQKLQLVELDSFVQSTDIELENILSILGWKVENLDADNGMEVWCPFNPGHRLPEKSLEQHLINCQWRAEGYNQFDIPLSESTLPPDAPSSIKIDKNLQAQILLTAKQKEPSMISGVGDRMIPRTSDRIFIDFTSDERKAIYDYVVANTQKVDIGHDIADLNQVKETDDQKSISYLELLAQERNLKRRRAKHRGVHTNKKSHVEVMREVIEQQMEIFKEYLAEQNPQNERTEASEEISSDFSKNSRPPEFSFEMKSESRKYSSERDANSFQHFERNGRHDYRENRREHYSQRSDRKDSHHRSHKRDRHRPSEERHGKRHKHTDKSKHRDSSRDRDTSRDGQRNRSKDRHKNRSREHREPRHDRRDRKRSRSKNRR